MRPLPLLLCLALALPARADEADPDEAPALELAEPLADCLARTHAPLTLDPAAQCALAAHLIADDLALTSARARQASAETCGEACRSALPAPVPWGPIVAVAGAVAVLAFAGGVIVGALGR